MKMRADKVQLHPGPWRACAQHAPDTNIRREARSRGLLCMKD